MKNRKKITIAIMLVIIATMSIAFGGCEYTTDKSSRWKTKFDISLPTLAQAGANANTANGDGWYATLLSDFEDNSLGNIWQPLKNCLRKEEYWCDKMVSVSDGKVNISAQKIDNHICDNCGDKSELYTSGITTYKTENGVSKPTFQQAFGYFEAKVKFPNSAGMWSAFWLQCNSQGSIGNGGVDGAEIDIYESSFFRNKSFVGNCIHYDGYGKHHKGGQATHDVGYDLYEGYHTFALKWTPNEYVFFVDGNAVWATDFGGVSRVATYIMLTNEIRQKATTGPYGQALDKFTGGTFVIESVNVYQNVNYLSSIVEK